MRLFMEGELMKFGTKREAAEAWVYQFNAIPISVVEKLWRVSGYEDFNEITPHAEDEDFYSTFPMWGTMWAFGDAIDNDWLAGEFGTDGIARMAECGFRIYESEDWGYVFGIDGAGYDFFEAHWIPLYDARGLKWHNEIYKEGSKKTIIDWKDKDAVRKYNAQKQREWRLRNPEKAIEAQLRSSMRQLERLRAQKEQVKG